MYGVGTDRTSYSVVTTEFKVVLMNLKVIRMRNHNCWKLLN